MKTFKLAIRAFTLISIIVLLGCQQATTPETPPAPEKSQDQKAVEAAAKKLTLPTEIKADEKGILLLDKVEGCAGVTVTWKSDKPAIIATDGTVTHADKAESDTVKLTATLKKGNGTATKTFTVTVKNKALSQDEKNVRAVKAELDIKKEVTSKESEIKLPEQIDGYADVKITWISNKPEVIENTGRVIHSDKTEDDTVTLNALIVSGDFSDKKTFIVTVKNEKFSEQKQQDIAKLNTAKESLNVSFTEIAETTNKVTFPELTGDTYKGITITWSSVPDIIKPDGTVTHNEEKPEESVILTATLKLNESTDTKDFPVTVKNKLSLQKRIEIVKEGLTVDHSTETTRTIPEDGNNISVSSENNYEGVTVEWKSSDESVIKKNPDMVGQWTVTHTRAAGDQIVTLTATITAKEGSEEGSEVKDTKVFTLTVKNPTKTLEQLKKEAITAVIEDLSGKINTTVTEYQTNIKLPTMIQGDLYGNANISWSSEKPNIIDAQGNVIHTTGQGDQAVKLTANITNMCIEDEPVTTTKVFDITVKNPATAPADNQILTIATDNLSIPSPTYQAGNNFGKVYLSKIQTVNDKTVSVSWVLSGNDEHFVIEESNDQITLVLKKDIIDVTGKIKATLTYNNDTASKEIDVPIPAIKNISGYTINGNTIESGSSRYSYTDLDLQNKTIKLTKTHEQRGNNNWVSIQDEKAALIEMFDDLEAKVNKVVQEPTIENLVPVMSMMPGETGTGETVTEDDCYAVLIENGCFENISSSALETNKEEAIGLAKASSPKEIEAAILNFETGLRKQMFPQNGLTEDASWKEFFDTQRAVYKPETPVKYAYIVGEYNLQFSATYDSTKQWYEQNGSYRENRKEYAADLRLNHGNTGSFSYYTGSEYRNCDITLNSDKNSFSAKYKDYSSGPGNATEKDDGTWTVTTSIENEKHFITVSKEGIELKLGFKGDSI